MLRVCVANARILPRLRAAESDAVIVSVRALIFVDNLSSESEIVRVSVRVLVICCAPCVTCLVTESEKVTVSAANALIFAASLAAKSEIATVSEIVLILADILANESEILIVSVSALSLPRCVAMASDNVRV